MFRSDPDGFAPKFGGWCAMAMTGGQVAEVDFDNGWTVDATGLYFNVNKDVRLRWLRGYNRNVGKGNENWPATRRAIKKGIRQFTVVHRCQITITTSKSPEKALLEQVVNDFLHQTIFAGGVIA